MNKVKFANVIMDGESSFVIKLEEGFLPLLAISESLVQNGVRVAKLEDAMRIREIVGLVENILKKMGSEISNDIISEGRVDGFLPCVTNPGKIVCIGLNYKRHAREIGVEIPREPVIFSKFTNSLAGHLDKVPIPRMSKQVDYEGELGIVIGRKTVNVKVNEALNHVFGYFIADDVSARDLQMRSGQWLLGKTCDKFAPIGPYIVSAEEITNPNNLAIRTYVNDKIRQESNTSDMIFYCDFIVSHISRHFPLDAGDIILTGTPEGVIFGRPEKERVWLREGDVVRIEIEGLGSLENTFYAPD